MGDAQRRKETFTAAAAVDGVFVSRDTLIMQLNKLSGFRFALCLPA